METVKLTKVKGEENLYRLDMKISKGKILAIVNALEFHGTPVANDLRFLILQESKDGQGRSFLNG